MTPIDMTQFQLPERKPKFTNPVRDFEAARNTLFALYERMVRNTASGSLIRDENTANNVRRVAHWITRSPKKGLLLLGSLGNGKTTMLRTLKVFLDGTGNWVGPICEATEIWRAERLSCLDDLNDESVVSSKNFIFRCYNERILIIDDLGVENKECKVFGEQRHPLEHLLLHRYTLDLTTIISTNLKSLDVIEERYGSRVVDRLYETYDRIVFEGESYRRKKR